MKWGILQAQPAQLLRAAGVLRGAAVRAPQGQPARLSQQMKVPFCWSCFQPGPGAQPAQFILCMKDLAKSLCLSDSTYSSLFQLPGCTQGMDAERRARASCRLTAPANSQHPGESLPKREQLGWQQPCTLPWRCPTFHKWQTTRNPSILKNVILGTSISTNFPHYPASKRHGQACSVLGRHSSSVPIVTDTAGPTLLIGSNHTLVYRAAFKHFIWTNSPSPQII